MDEGAFYTDSEKLIQGIIDAEKRRLAEAEAKLKTRIGEAHREAHRLAREFAAADPALKKVILFGSLAEGRVRSEHFDIDLAVDSDRHLELVSIGLDSAFPVDVVELNTLPDAIRRRVIEKGEVLYES